MASLRCCRWHTRLAAGCGRGHGAVRCCCWAGAARLRAAVAHDGSAAADRSCFEMPPMPCPRPPSPGSRDCLPQTPNPTVGELYTHYRKQAQDQYLLSRGVLDTGEFSRWGVLKNARRLSLLLPLGASRAAVALQERAAALSACWSRAGQGCQCRAFLRACCLAQSLSSSRRQ